MLHHRLTPESLNDFGRRAVSGVAELLGGELFAHLRRGGGARPLPKIRVGQDEDIVIRRFVRFQVGEVPAA